jgi:serine/threonine protein kinase
MSSRTSVGSISNGLGLFSKSKERKSFIITTALDDVYRELEIMKKLSHPNIIKLVEIIDDLDSGKLYAVMEYASSG